MKDKKMQNEFVDNFRERVEARIEALGFDGYSAFCAEHGLDKGNFCHMLDEPNPRLDSLLKLASQLKVKPEWFFAPASRMREHERST